MKDLYYQNQLCNRKESQLDPNESLMTITINQVPPVQRMNTVQKIYQSKARKGVYEMRSHSRLENKLRDQSKIEFTTHWNQNQALLAMSMQNSMQNQAEDWSIRQRKASQDPMMSNKFSSSQKIEPVYKQLIKDQFKKRGIESCLNNVFDEKPVHKMPSMIGQKQFVTYIKSPSSNGNKYTLFKPNKQISFESYLKYRPIKKNYAVRQVQAATSEYISKEADYSKQNTYTSSNMGNKMESDKVLMDQIQSNSISNHSSIVSRFPNKRLKSLPS